MTRKNSKKQEAKAKPEKKKKSKFLVSEDDNVDINSLDRNSENASVTRDVVENFVCVLFCVH